MTPMTPSNGTPVSLESDRVIRVFISSTFRDMQEERDVLVKKVFPQLRSSASRGPSPGPRWTCAGASLKPNEDGQFGHSMPGSLPSRTARLSRRSCCWTIDKIPAIFLNWQMIVFWKEAGVLPALGILEAEP